MTRYDVHVVPQGDQWAVIRVGDDVPVSLHATRAGAELAGRELATDGGVSFEVHPHGQGDDVASDDPRLDPR